jgi:hypothetical protein
MNFEMDERVIQTIVDVAIFFEFSENDIINPDISIQMLEQIAATLQSANEDTKKKLCVSFKKLSNNYFGKQHEFVKNLCNIFGLE